jgi:hypothetical protein
MAGEHRLGTDADLVDHAGPKVLDQDVGRLRELVELFNV